MEGLEHDTMKMTMMMMRKERPGDKGREGDDKFNGKNCRQQQNNDDEDEDGDENKQTNDESSKDKDGGFPVNEGKNCCQSHEAKDCSQGEHLLIHFMTKFAEIIQNYYTTVV